MGRGDGEIVVAHAEIDIQVFGRRVSNRAAHVEASDQVMEQHPGRIGIRAAVVDVNRIEVSVAEDTEVGIDITQLASIVADVDDVVVIAGMNERVAVDLLDPDVIDGAAGVDMRDAIGGLDGNRILAAIGAEGGGDIGAIDGDDVGLVTEPDFDCLERFGRDRENRRQGSGQYAGVVGAVVVEGQVSGAGAAVVVDDESIHAVIEHRAINLGSRGTNHQVVAEYLDGGSLVLRQVVLRGARRGTVVLNPCGRQLVGGLYFETLGIVVNQRRGVRVGGRVEAVRR